MRLALDTNRCTDLFRGDAEVSAQCESATEIFLPFVVVAEMRFGFLKGSKRRSNERDLLRLLGKRGVSVLYADDQTTHWYADVRSRLQRKGTPIPTHDVWIAALAFQHLLTLYSRDAHFDHLPQLSRV